MVLESRKRELWKKEKYRNGKNSRKDIKSADAYQSSTVPVHRVHPAGKCARWSLAAEVKMVRNEMRLFVMGS